MYSSTFNNYSTTRILRARPTWLWGFRTRDTWDHHEVWCQEGKTPISTVRNIKLFVCPEKVSLTTFYLIARQFLIHDDAFMLLSGPNLR